MFGKVLRLSSSTERMASVAIGKSHAHTLRRYSTFVFYTLLAETKPSLRIGFQTSFRRLALSIFAILVLGLGSTSAIPKRQ